MTLTAFRGNNSAHALMGGLPQGVVAPSSDPYIANVSLLLHGEGVDGGTVITDVKGHAATRVGNPVTSVAQAKYGSASLLFDGSSAVTFPTGVDFNFGTGEFTMECLVYQTSHAATQSIMCCSSGSGSSGMIVQISNTGQVATSTAAAGIINSGSQLVPLNTWTHVAVSRKAGTLYVFVNGVLGGSGAYATGITDGVCHIGQFSAGSQRYVGYMDEVRITKGVGRYSSGFTPIGPFPDV